MTELVRLESSPAAPRPQSNSRKSAQKRDAIIRVAIEIINAKSYPIATMTEIAAALNLRDATLYYYFPNKAALAYACHLRSLERFEGLLRDADRVGGTGAAKLRRLVLGLLTDSAKNGSQIYFGDHSYLEADQRKHILEWAGHLTAMTEKFLKDGIADGSLVPCETELVVQLLLGMLIWLARWVPKIDGMTVDRLMTAIGAFSLDGLETAKRPGPAGPGL